MHIRFKMTVALAMIGPAGAAMACASCGCSVNSDWGAQGLSAAGGWTLDLRTDYLNQDRLRTGTQSISAATASQTLNTQTQSPAEVEQYTRNRYLTGTVDYNDGQNWGVSLSLPFIQRTHSTLGTGSDGATFDPANGAYRSSANGLGDVRVLGRYFGWTEAHNVGLQWGLKLPTGAKSQVSDSGSIQPVDPGLQLGTGTTDMIVGGYLFDSLSPDWAYFSQLNAQVALNHSTMAGGSYRPGNSVNASLGVRYVGWSLWFPTVQLNARYARPDSGDAADTYATGGRLVYLTLGGVVPVTSTLNLYANLQLPVYQNVNGIQLTPRYVASVGAKFAF